MDTNKGAYELNPFNWPSYDELKKQSEIVGQTLLLL